MKAIYDKIGEDYDTTRRADPVLVKRISDLLGLVVGKRYIDVACGTGNYTVELNDSNGNWVGIDNSYRMHQSAIEKDVKVSWCNGDAESIPFRSESFNGAICTLAIHHFVEIEKAFSEIGRIIMKRGSFVIFTALPNQLSGYWLNEYFPDAMKESANQLPGQSLIVESLRKAGFKIECLEAFDVTPQLSDFFLYSGKHRPEIYLSAAVRKGISTFSRLATDSELASGLARLAHDIDTGHIQDIIQKYPGGPGDYQFIQAKKI